MRTWVLDLFAIAWVGEATPKRENATECRAGLLEKMTSSSGKGVECDGTVQAGLSEGFLQRGGGTECNQQLRRIAVLEEVVRLEEAHGLCWIGM